MLIFLVVTRYKNGHWDERAFVSYGAARAYAVLQRKNCEAEILDVPVMGELYRPDCAYTIRWHDLTPDTRNVEAVYGSYRQARRAAGNQGHVQELRIDGVADIEAQDDNASFALADGQQPCVVESRHAMA